MNDEEMEALIARLDSELSDGWVDIVEWLRSQNSVEDIARRIREGRIDDAIDGLRQAAERFADDTQAAYSTAAQHARDWLDQSIDDRLFTYNTGNPRAAQWAASNRYDAIRQVTEDQRGMIRAVQIDGIRDGVNPIATAARMRDGLGLTDHQEAIVENMRRKLRDGDLQGALTARLMDGRSARTIQSALDGGNALTDAQIDLATERYRENWIDYRAKTIARTEGLRTAHQGTHEMYQQAIDNGQLNAEELVRVWRAPPKTGDFREQHQTMDGQEIGMDEPFIAPDGTRLMFPGDPDAPIEHTAGCRCTVTVRYRTSTAVTPSRQTPEVPQREDDAIDPATLAPARAAIQEASRLPMPNLALQPMDHEQFKAMRATFEETLPNEEFEALVSYSGERYEAINRALRKGGETPEMIDHMDRGIARHRAPQDLKVLRGAGTGTHFEGLKVGDIYQDKAFLSTSIDRQVVEEFADVGGDLGTIWEIEIPKGAFAAPIPSQNDGELEFLLPRNSKLRVLEIKRDGEKTIYRAILEP